jgi:hypothetical protein
MLAVVAPVLHLYVVPVDEVKVTAVPGHKPVVVAGDEVMVGVAGAVV